MHQSIPAAAKQPPHLPPPSRYRGAFARLVSPGGGVFANFVLPGGRAFANPGDIPERLTSKRFPISILLHKGFYWERKQIGSSVMDMKKIREVCKGMFLILCMHFFIAYQTRITGSEIRNYRRESTFFGYWIKFLLILFEKHPFIFIKLFITYNFTALY